MSFGNPYDELGRILSEGGEQAIALAIANDYSTDRIDAILLRFAPDATPADRQYVFNFAEDMIAGAAYLNSLSPGDEIDINRIPVNPLLYGDDPEGRRIFTSVDVSLNDLPGRYRIDIDLADAMTLADALDRLRDEAERRIKGSPNAFGVSSLDSVDQFTWTFTVVERRF